MYYCDLQAVAWLFQQGLLSGGKATNSVGVQSERSMSQLFFSLCWNPEELGSNSRKVTPRHMNLPVKSESKQVNTKSFLLPCTFK